MLWGISTRSIIKRMHRCWRASRRTLEVTLANAITWRDPSEHARISIEFAKKGFHKCVGLLDGTTLLLTKRSKVDDINVVYFDRKKQYSINMQIVSNDKKKIIHISTITFHHIHSMVICFCF